MKRIIIQRASPHAFAYLPVSIIVGAPGFEQARRVTALLDTGADYTVVRASILAEFGIATSGRTLGFTGAGATLSAQQTFNSASRR